MLPTAGIVKSSDSDFIASCVEVGDEIGVSLTVFDRAPVWLLALLNDDFGVAIFEWDCDDPDNLAWIQLVRRTRPKVPLVVIHDCPLDQLTGAKFCEEKVFYFCQQPVDRELLRNVLDAALQSFRHHNGYSTH